MKREETQTISKRTKIGERKFLTFSLDREEYGIEILRVREIIGVMDVTYVPGTPDFVRGVINLRGKIIPVIDLKYKFGLGEAEITEKSCIIVVDVNSNGRVIQTGLLVD
ncbi:MAG TPA: purine-binding chemotaxis protein CheW, partial [Candidatus Marinimicrobia bacterium]|nr:purine-binding chemotaxis protein CheW [Candidatus Neomarinimicrobiota bacterium]